MLKYWAIHFIKNKDLIKRSISKISDQDDMIQVEHKSYIHNFKIMEDLTQIVNLKNELESIKTDKTSIVTLNTKSNFDFLLDNWDTFSEFDRHFSLIFVNEKSHKDKKWIVYPFTHHRLSDDYKLGLAALFDSVDSL